MRPARSALTSLIAFQRLAYDVLVGVLIQIALLSKAEKIDQTTRYLKCKEFLSLNAASCVP